jgi:hypothetical protein
MLVAPYTTKDNIILLSPLESVHAGHFNIFVQFLLERPVELHVVDDIRPLPFVGCHHANIGSNNPRLEKLGHNLLHIGGFRPASTKTNQNLNNNKMVDRNRTYSKTKCHSTISPPDPDSDKRTWVCQEQAMGNPHSFSIVPAQ